MVICPIKTFFSMQILNLLGSFILREYFNKKLYICKHFMFQYDDEYTGHYLFRTYWDNVIEVKDATWVEYKENNSIESHDVLRYLYHDGKEKRRRQLQTKKFIYPDVIVMNPRTFLYDFKGQEFTKFHRIKYAPISTLHRNCSIKIKPTENWNDYIGIYYTFNHRHLDPNLINQIKTFNNERILLVTDNLFQAKETLYPLFKKSNQITIFPSQIFETMELDLDNESVFNYQKLLFETGANLATCKEFFPFFSDQYSCIYIQFIRFENGNTFNRKLSEYGPVEIFFNNPEVPIGSDI